MPSMTTLPHRNKDQLNQQSNRPAVSRSCRHKNLLPNRDRSAVTSQHHGHYSQSTLHPMNVYCELLTRPIALSCRKHASNTACCEALDSAVHSTNDSYTNSRSRRTGRVKTELVKSDVKLYRSMCRSSAVDNVTNKRRNDRACCETCCRITGDATTQSSSNTSSGALGSGYRNRHRSQSETTQRRSVSTRRQTDTRPVFHRRAVSANDDQLLQRLRMLTSRTRRTTAWTGHRAITRGKMEDNSDDSWTELRIMGQSFITVVEGQPSSNTNSEDCCIEVNQSSHETGKQQVRVVVNRSGHYGQHTAGHRMVNSHITFTDLLQACHAIYSVGKITILCCFST